MILEKINTKTIFEYNNSLINNISALRDDFDELTLSIYEIIKSKEIFNGDKLRYLQSLSTVNVKILLKLEMEILKNNGTNQKRVEKIQRMLNGEEQISMIEEKEKITEELKK